MAIYTRYEAGIGQITEWRDGFSSNYIPDPNVITFVGLSTVSKAFGQFVVLNGNLLGGVVTSVERSSPDGTSLYESVTGLAIDALAFVSGDKFKLMFAGKDTLHGGSGSDVLSGEDQDDVIYGNGGNDSLYGGDGGGVDTMAGGPGDDLYYIDADDVIIEAPNEGIDSIITQLTNYTLPENFENLTLSTGSTAVGIGNSLDNKLTGGWNKDKLYGLGGNDTFDGYEGGDVFYGGEGDDTAVFWRESIGEHKFEDHAVGDLGDRIIVSGPYGGDTLYSIEHLEFFDGTIHVNDGSGVFDTLHYMANNLDVYHAGANALEHYNVHGWHEGRDPNGWFDTSGYLAVNKDVAAAGINPFEHYHQTGWKEGRDPAANFDTTLYLINNPDVAAAGVDPLEHFLQFGLAEGRKFYNAVDSNISNGFDAQYYLLRNPDVAAAGVDPLQHFNQFGWHEGRNPNGWFDTAGYLSHYADVAASGANPLQHYEQFGWHEGRDPSASFDTLGYLAANPDVAAAGVNPLDHFLQNGIYEGRHAVNDGMWH